jgi:hypothetical protein
MKDIKGHKYNLLTVIEFSHLNPKSRHAIWKCRCDCGQEILTETRLLRNGRRKSCGCLRRKLVTGKRAKKWMGYEDLSLSKFNGYKNDAKRRGLIFEITIEEAWRQLKLQGFKCALSGEDIVLPVTTKSFDGTASLDRIDSNKGYIKGNIQWVHKDVNVMKWDLSLERFKELCKKITLQG